MSQIKLKKNNVPVPIRSELKHLFEEIIAQLSRDFKNPNFPLIHIYIISSSDKHNTKS